MRMEAMAAAENAPHDFVSITAFRGQKVLWPRAVDDSQKPRMFLATVEEICLQRVRATWHSCSEGPIRVVIG